MVYVTALIVAGCTQDEAGGEAPDEHPCIICQPGEPGWRACEAVRVASGGQPVCDEGDVVVPCARPVECTRG